jgi:hypothetical protein
MLQINPHDLRIKTRLGGKTMKKLSAGLVILAILIVVGLRSVHSQTVARNAGLLGYDVTKEVTITAMVSGVLTQPAPGMIAGSHLLLATPSGAVDASLGRLGLRGNGAAPVSAGQQVELTGVMKTIKGKPLFLVRTVNVGGEVYAIRNEHGVLLSPQARERASQKTGKKGESL